MIAYFTKKHENEINIYKLLNDSCNYIAYQTYTHKNICFYAANDHINISIDGNRERYDYTEKTLILLKSLLLN